MRRAVYTMAVLVLTVELSGSGRVHAQPPAARHERANPSDAAAAEGDQERISRALALVDAPFTMPEVLQTKGGQWRIPVDVRSFFENAVIFTPTEAREGVEASVGEVKPNELLFTAREKGLVLVAVPRTYDGDRTGGWFETRTSEEDLRASGWKGLLVAILTSGNRDYSYAIFARSVDKGERFRFHSRKVRPPQLIVPDRELAEKLLAARARIPHATRGVDVERRVGQFGELGRSASSRNALLLGVHHWDGFHDSGSLLREIVRQALLMMVREEFGIQTRDRSLRETLPDAAPGITAPVEVLAAPEIVGSVRIVLFRRPGGKVEELWNELIALDRRRFITELAATCEGFSRSDFVEALEGAGYERRAGSWREGADALDEERERRLRSLNLIDQFALVRDVHREIREQGESAERLSALSRGYGHLGSLTEHHCSAAHKTFKARALLYAERLVARSRHSRFALQNRAYVRALVGLHAEALADLGASRADRADAEPVSDPPPWCDVVEAYCRFDRPELDRLARDERRRALCNYLWLLMVENLEYSTIVLDAAQRVLKDNPACFRALDALAQEALGIKRVATGAAFAAYPRYVYPLLGKLEGLPTAAIAVLDKIEDDPTAEIDLRPKLLSALRAAGAPEHDRGEPSLDLLAQLLQELSFVQCLRLVTLEHDTLAVPVAETLNAVRPLIDGHPYQALLESFALSPSELRARHAELKKHLHDAELELSCERLLRQLETGNGRGERHISHPLYRHVDMIYGDLSRLEDGGTSEIVRVHFGNWLPDVSPHSPLSVAYRIQWYWDQVKDSAKQLEEQYSWSGEVLHRLAARYVQESQFDDAERCLVRRLKASSSPGAHLQLANFYKDRGRIEKWRAVLEQFLEQPSYGIEHARVRVRIAEDYMARQEWKKALPYAVEAAESWSGWSLMCAARCYEGLEDWKNAELYVRRTAERYASASLEWFYWCKRTGHGDVQAAQEHADEYLQSLASPLSAKYLIHVGAVSQLTGDDAEALKVFTAIYEHTSDPETGLRAALLADRLNKPELRDELLAKITDPKRRGNPPQMSLLIELAGEFARVLGGGNAKLPDASGITRVRKAASGGEAVSIDYFAGVFLAAHGDMAAAREHLKAAAQAGQNSIDSVFAADALRRMAPEKAPAEAREGR